ncbi:MAG: hypothetical protein HC786_16330 [Richelia sp. CSU_2_1]|nr:hypothetical protein [Richelia sp. CSU_2_1]
MYSIWHSARGNKSFPRVRSSWSGACYVSAISIARKSSPRTGGTPVFCGRVVRNNKVLHRRRAKHITAAGLYRN